MPRGQPTTAGNGDIQAVQRVAGVLRLFSLGLPRVTVAEAARRLDVNRTTMHRYFNSLVQTGFLERDHDKTAAFVPGPLLLQLGVIAQGQRRVLEIAPRFLYALSAEANLTAVLSLWTGDSPVVSLVSESAASSMLITVRVGTQLGVDTAQMRVFLAHLQDESLLRNWASKVPPDDRGTFDRCIAEARREGMTLVRLPELSGVIVAAAVFDQHGIAATVALVGTESSLSSGASDKTDALRRAADAITDELGGTPTRDQMLEG